MLLSVTRCLNQSAMTQHPSQKSSTAPARIPNARRAWGFRARGLFGALILIPIGALALFSPPAVAENSWAGLVLRLLGWMTFLAALLTRLWATIYLGGYKENTLITDGPYSICRNPLYLGSLLIGLSIGVFLGSITFVAGIFITMLCYIALTIPAEETLLRQRHGAAFDQYCNSTPRLVPRLSAFLTESTKAVRISALRTEVRRLRFWILLPFLGELSIHLRSQPWWPHLRPFH